MGFADRTTEVLSRQLRTITNAQDRFFTHYFTQIRFQSIVIQDRKWATTQYHRFDGSI